MTRPELFGLFRYLYHLLYPHSARVTGAKIHEFGRSLYLEIIQLFLTCVGDNFTVPCWSHSPGYGTRLYGKLLSDPTLCESI